jgi:hypothetical protein
MDTASMRKRTSPKKAVEYLMSHGADPSVCDKANLSVISEFPDDNNNARFFFYNNVGFAEIYYHDKVSTKGADVPIHRIWIQQFENFTEIISNFEEV